MPRQKAGVGPGQGLGTTWEQRHEARRGWPPLQVPVCTGSLQRTPSYTREHKLAHWSGPRWQVGETQGPERVSSRSQEVPWSSRFGPGGTRAWLSCLSVRLSVWLALSGLGCPCWAAMLVSLCAQPSPRDREGGLGQLDTHGPG